MKEISFTSDTALFCLSCDPDDSGDYLIALESKIEGFRGHADGHIAGKDWHEFKDALNKLEKNRKGSARLASALPKEFDILIQAIDSLGHMSVSGELRYRKNERSEQRLHFEFEFEPSQLVAAVKSINAEKQ